MVENVKIWHRKCPKCGDELSHKSKGYRNYAEKQNVCCKSCVKIGKNNPNWDKPRSEEIKKKIGDTNKGENNGMYGKCPWNKGKTGIYSENTRKQMGKGKEVLIGENNPAKRPEVREKISESKMGDKNPAKRPEVRKKISETLKGRKLSDEHKKNCRLSALKRIEKQNGQVMPNHNPVGCDIIRWFNMYYGFNFQHAENGGEICIDGYFPDGVDEKRKTIIEIDEPHHFDSNGNLRPKDIKRQKFLENLGYEFIRITI